MNLYFIHTSIYLPPSIFIPVYLSIHPSLSLVFYHDHLPLYISVSTHLFPSIFSYTYESLLHPYIYLPTSINFHPCLSIYSSIFIACSLSRSSSALSICIYSSISIAFASSTLFIIFRFIHLYLFIYFHRLCIFDSTHSLLYLRIPLFNYLHRFYIRLKFFPASCLSLYISRYIKPSIIFMPYRYRFLSIYDRYTFYPFTHLHRQPCAASCTLSYLCIRIIYFLINPISRFVIDSFFESICTSHRSMVTHLFLGPLLVSFLLYYIESIYVALLTWFIFLPSLDLVESLTLYFIDHLLFPFESIYVASLT